MYRDQEFKLFRDYKCIDFFLGSLRSLKIKGFNSKMKDTLLVHWEKPKSFMKALFDLLFKINQRYLGCLVEAKPLGHNIVGS